MRTLLLLSLLLLPAGALAKPTTRPEPVFLLEGRKVSEKEWEKFLRTLTGQANYVCKKMAGGGETSYIARDAQKRKYGVRQRTTDTENRNEITRAEK